MCSVNLDSDGDNYSAQAHPINIQLELGSTATTPTPPMKHTTSISPHRKGRSVPSAKDSVEVQDGKLVHVKRVSEYMQMSDADTSALARGVAYAMSIDYQCV